MNIPPVAPARRALVQRAACDGRRMGLVMPYIDGLSQVMRELGAGWSPMRRMWVCDVDGMRRLLDGLQRRASGWPAVTLEGARETALAAWRSPQPDFFVQLLDVQLIALEGGAFAVTSGYDAWVVRALKQLGGRYHKPASAWEVQASQDEILESLLSVAGLPREFVFIHDGVAVLEKLVAAGASELPISVPGAQRVAPAGRSGPAFEADGSGFLSAFGTPLSQWPVDEEALAAAARACSLRDYQVAGVRHLISHSSALLADDMGLGKTRQAVVASRLAAGTATVLVTCPASLTINWQREIEAVYPNARIAHVGQHSDQRVAQADWVIANYERLGSLVRRTELHLEVMVIDEAHYLKEHQTGRTRNAFVLSERIPRRFLLTGTPILNRELELHTLLRLSGHPLGYMPLSDFRKAFAGDADKRSELASRVSEWMLRRGKDVLKDLGAKTQQVRYVQAEDDLAGYRAILEDTLLQAMPKITLLRQHLESLKLPFILESMQCLAPDVKAIIFCEFMETVDALKEALEAMGIGCLTLVGTDSTKKRMAAVDAFQKSQQTRVFITTTKAGGVGITLTAATYVFFASLPWTPALKRQAEDRAYRSGQTRDVLVIIPVVAGTIDEKIFGLLDNKRAIEVSIIESNRSPVHA